MRTSTFLLAAVLATAARASGEGAATGAGQGRNVVSRVSVTEHGGRVVVSITGTRPPSFTTFTLSDPPRFVVDLAGATLQGVPAEQVVGGTVQGVQALSLADQRADVARVILTFAAPVEPPEVVAAGNALEVRIDGGKAVAGAPVAPAQPKTAALAKKPVPAGTAAGRSAHPATKAPKSTVAAKAETAPKPEATAKAAEPAAAPKVAAAPKPESATKVAKAAAATKPESATKVAKVAAAPKSESATKAAKAAVAPTVAKASRVAAAPKPAPRPAARTTPQELRELGFRSTPEGSRVFVRTSVAPRFTISQDGERAVRVELPDTVIRNPNNARALDTRFFPGAVAAVSPSRHGRSMVLAIALREQVAYTQRVDGDTLSIDFASPGGAAGSEAALPGAAPAAPAAEAPPALQAPVEAPVAEPEAPASK